MEEFPMFVGIDVSKERLDVAIRPSLCHSRLGRSHEAPFCGPSALRLFLRMLLTYFTDPMVFGSFAALTTASGGGLDYLSLSARPWSFSPGSPKARSTASTTPFPFTLWYFYL